MQKGNNLNEPFRFSRHVNNYHTLLSTCLTNDQSINIQKKIHNLQDLCIHMQDIDKLKKKLLNIKGIGNKSIQKIINLFK